MEWSRFSLVVDITRRIINLSIQSGRSTLCDIITRLELASVTASELHGKENHSRVTLRTTKA